MNVSMNMWLIIDNFIHNPIQYIISYVETCLDYLSL
jgi:hypothetical protein